MRGAEKGSKGPLGPGGGGGGVGWEASGGPGRAAGAAAAPGASPPRRWRWGPAVRAAGSGPGSRRPPRGGGFNPSSRKAKAAGCCPGGFLSSPSTAARRPAGLFPRGRAYRRGNKLTGL